MFNDDDTLHILIQIHLCIGVSNFIGQIILNFVSYYQIVILSGSINITQQIYKANI